MAHKEIVDLFEAAIGWVGWVGGSGLYVNFSVCYGVIEVVSLHVFMEG
jgi:hypothetical protein